MPVLGRHEASAPYHAEGDPRAKASTYQKEILRWIELGRGDAIVEAVAGSGKTTTLQMAWRQIQESRGACRAIFLAFNRSIAEELRQKLPGLEARTLHSLGNAATTRWLGSVRGRLRERKYVDIARQFLVQAGSGRDASNRFLLEDLKKVVDLARIGLVDPWDVDELKEIVDRHDIGRAFRTVERYLFLVADICDVGRAYAAQHGEIDFADQIWLPHVENISLEQYDWILVDESQDLNAAQLQLVLRSRAREGRILFVGDPKQAIYGFAGADNFAMERIRQHTGAVRLPLSITYRCPRSHVDVARRLVPHLEARDNAPEGVFAQISLLDATRRMQPGDLVLCRLTWPAVALQRFLDDQHRDAYVQDTEKGKQLSSLMFGYVKRGVKLPNLSQQLQMDIERLERSDGVNRSKSERVDLLKTLLIVVRGRQARSMEEMQGYIDRVFNPRASAVRCMTIHRSKGLEADRVFLIQPDFIPSRYAQQKWQLDEEENLLYVALTRGKHELYVCHGQLLSDGTLTGSMVNDARFAPVPRPPVAVPMRTSSSPVPPRREADASPVLQEVSAPVPSAVPALGELPWGAAAEDALLSPASMLKTKRASKPRTDTAFAISRPTTSFLSFPDATGIHVTLERDLFVARTWRCHDGKWQPNGGALTFLASHGRLVAEALGQLVGQLRLLRPSATGPINVTSSHWKLTLLASHTTGPKVTVLQIAGRHVDMDAFSGSLTFPTSIRSDVLEWIARQAREFSQRM